ncbi:MAG: hypothetical protein B0W54_00295 [Cellvibrio sp. 79]|nr:MAG: hypothetical protein B0W54_00295 [Cellvibrio sp. 79]
MVFLPITTALVNSSRVASSDFLTQICTATLAIYPDSGPVFPWMGYLVEEQGVFTGACAFKSLPVDGTVEIAYFTFPEYEGNGNATNMAKHLIRIASAHGARRVTAQTLPEHNASTHILQKLQFVFAGVVQHPEDGEVWEWGYPVVEKIK